MCLVAGEAVGLDHVTGVRAMAVGAVGDFAMNGVTGGTGKLGVLRRMLAQLIDLLGMAGEAGIGMLFREGYDQRGMRIGVAAKAVFQFEMFFA